MLDRVSPAYKNVTCHDYHQRQLNYLDWHKLNHSIKHCKFYSILSPILDRFRLAIPIRHFVAGSPLRQEVMI